MPAYAFALLRNVKINDQIASYISRIDATLAPFGGAFKIHGGRTEVVEGAFDHTLVAIAFPDMDHARRWYTPRPTRPSCRCAPTTPKASPS